MTDPSAGDRWNGQHNRDHQDTLAIRNSKNSAKQYQGKQNRYNNISAFDFFDKGKKEEKQRKSNEELHVAKPTESWYS
jgi:hypothetical protein